MFVCQMVKVWL